MRPLPLATIVLAIVGAHPVLSQQAERTAGLDAPLWRVFANEVGTRVDYPSGIFATDTGPAPRGTGRELRSTDERARLLVYVESNTERYTPSRFLRAQMRSSGAQLDYQRVTNRFFAVSGTNADQVFYSRCNFPSGAAGPFHCMYVTYPRSEERLWDGIVTRMSLSLRPLR
jgi:hypothetical protein